MRSKDEIIDMLEKRIKIEQSDYSDLYERWTKCEEENRKLKQEIEELKK